MATAARPASTSSPPRSTVAGTFNVTASAGKTSGSFTLTNTPGSAAGLAVSAGSPQSATVGKDFATPLQVQVTDQYGNPLTGTAVSGIKVTFTTTAGPTGATGNFAGKSTATAKTDDTGIATAPTLTANKKTGDFTVTATANGLTAATFNLTNTAAAAAKIVRVAGSDPSARVNTASALPLEVRVTDAYGNPVQGVAVTFTAPARGAGVTTTDAAGLASSTVTANATAGKFRVTATAAGINARSPSP